MTNFFFSSRRRHTRYWRDWSSDVCSSDLPSRFAFDCVTLYRHGDVVDVNREGEMFATARRQVTGQSFSGRSEERRVGKEGRSRRSPYQYKKKTASGRDKRCKTGWKITSRM